MGKYAAFIYSVFACFLKFRTQISLGRYNEYGHITMYTQHAHRHMQIHNTSTLN